VRTATGLGSSLYVPRSANALEIARARKHIQSEKKIRCCRVGAVRACASYFDSYTYPCILILACYITLQYMTIPQPFTQAYSPLRGGHVASTSYRNSKTPHTADGGHRFRIRSILSFSETIVGAIVDATTLCSARKESHQEDTRTRTEALPCLQSHARRRTGTLPLLHCRTTSPVRKRRQQLHPGYGGGC